MRLARSTDKAPIEPPAHRYAPLLLQKSHDLIPLRKLSLNMYTSVACGWPETVERIMRAGRVGNVPNAPGREPLSAAASARQAPSGQPRRLPIRREGGGKRAEQLLHDRSA
jgi:hypothetical protein